MKKAIVLNTITQVVLKMKEAHAALHSPLQPCLTSLQLCEL